MTAKLSNTHVLKATIFTTTALVFMILAANMLEGRELSGSRIGVAKKDALAENFQAPPFDSGIRCFWWWLNGNVTKAAITRDLEEMHDKGYTGALIFDADGSAQRGNQRVPAGPVFAGPEWTELFAHACKEAARLDLELSLNLQSGWNLGGPKVSAAEATQHLIWSETKIRGPSRIERKLARPSGVNDFYRDVAVLAVPLSESSSSSSGDVDTAIDASSTQSEHHPARYALDGDPETFWVSNTGPTATQPQWLLLELSKSAQISELYLRGRSGYGPRKCEIQLSRDGKKFRKEKVVSLKDGETYVAKLDNRTSKYIRLLFTSAYDRGGAGGTARNVQVAEVFLPDIMEPARDFRPIENLKLKSATRELGGSAPDCRHLLNSSPPRPGEPVVESKKIIDISDKMGKDGTLRWKAPEGEWALIRFGHTATGAHVSTHSKGWGGRVLDYMNPKALRSYWQRNIAPLIEEIGPLAGDTLRYTHTDSWEGGGMNWTPGFDKTFKQNRGYDPVPWLAVMAGYVVDSRLDSNAFLADLRKTIGDLVADHYALLAELSREHGIGTHPECSGPHAGPLDGLKNYGRSELMMSEFWAPSPHRPTPSNRFFVKQAASAAHTYGARLVGAEGFTTIGTHWNVVPWSMMKPSFDHEFCEGLNILFHHTFTCSPEEMGVPGQEYFAGTHFNPQITWWDETPAFIDYMRRCQYLAQQADFVADVVYYYGDHIPNIAHRKADDPAGALPGFDYDALSEELLLADLSVYDGELALSSGMKYRVLALPDHKILSLGALEKVDQLVRAGATVLGPKPRRAVSLEGGAEGKARFQQLADGLWGNDQDALGEAGSRKVGKGRIAWGMTARELLLSDGVVADVSFEDKSMHGDIGWIHYRTQGADVYFLSNQSEKMQDFSAIFRCSDRLPELWDAVDGSIRKARSFRFVEDGRTQVPLELCAYDSIFVVFRRPAKGDRDDGPNFPGWETVKQLEGPWQVAFDPEWGGPQKPVSYASLKSWTASGDPGIKYYSGKARYSTRFELDAKYIEDGQTLAISLGRVEDLGIARVIVNGKDLGVVWNPPFQVDISAAVKPGSNRLEVDVVNSWRNRLLRDSKLPREKRLTRTNIKVQDWRSAKWRLEESGLLGPVRLKILERDSHSF